METVLEGSELQDELESLREQISQLKPKEAEVSEAKTLIKYLESRLDAEIDNRKSTEAALAELNRAIERLKEDNFKLKYYLQEYKEKLEATKGAEPTQNGHEKDNSAVPDGTVISPQLEEVIIFAATQGHPKMLEMIIDKYLDGTAKTYKNQYGWTLLMEAANKGQIEIAELLFKKEAEVDALSPKGWTPLHMAAAKGHLKMVEFLIDQGKADHKIENYQEETPLDVAKARKRPDVVEYLESLEETEA